MNLALLQLCDSLFPLGGFGYSDGLESATSAGRVTSAADLGEWMDACLDETIGRFEGPAVWQAWTAVCAGDCAALDTLDEESIALRPSSAARQSSRAMGSRLLATWCAVRPNHRLAPLRRASLPVAFGAICASTGVARRDAVEAFAYTRLAATISAAMRLMAIGQTDAHTLLARRLERVPAVVDRIASCGARIESFSPQTDMAAMSQQYLHSRLFRS